MRFSKSLFLACVDDTSIMPIKMKKIDRQRKRDSKREREREREREHCDNLKRPLRVSSQLITCWPHCGLGGVQILCIRRRSATALASLLACQHEKAER